MFGFTAKELASMPIPDGLTVDEHKLRVYLKLRHGFETKFAAIADLAFSLTRRSDAYPDGHREKEITEYQLAVLDQASRTILGEYTRLFAARSGAGMVTRRLCDAEKVRCKIL